MAANFTGAGYVGNFVVGYTLIDAKITTATIATGAPVTIAGSPVVSVYINGNTTEITTGVTLTQDYDSRTGMHDIAITTASGYSAGDHCAVFTAGTANAVSLVGYVAYQFSLGAVRTGDNNYWLGGAIAAVATTGIPIVDNKYLLGTVIATPATAGIFDVNIKNIGGMITAGAAGKVAADLAQ